MPSEEESESEYHPKELLDKEFQEKIDKLLKDALTECSFPNLTTARLNLSTLRAQRDGVLYVKNHTIYQLTGYEALLLQGFPKEYADKVKNEVSDRHLLMQAGNAMTVNVIHALGSTIVNFLKETKED